MQKQGRLLLVGLIVVLVGVGLYFALRASSKSQPVTVNVDEVQAQIDAGQYDAARDALEELIATDPENAEAHFMLGLTYFNLGEYDKAKASFSQAMTLEPERAAAVHHTWVCWRIRPARWKRPSRSSRLLWRPTLVIQTVTTSSVRRIYRSPFRILI